eukprot:6899523-Pyramimonas_sp.AAC.1
MGKTEDKRLSIDFSSLRHGNLINRVVGIDTVLQRIFCGGIQWANASNMVVHCLAQNMSAYLCVKISCTSSHDVTAYPEPTITKVKKQLARAGMNAIPSGKCVTES